jgi:hypothetical protein
MKTLQYISLTVSQYMLRSINIYIYNYFVLLGTNAKYQLYGKVQKSHLVKSKEQQCSMELFTKYRSIILFFIPRTLA